MPTKKRRLNIILPPEVDEALREFSEVTGQSQASFVQACLVENVESLRLLTQAVKEAKSGNTSQYQALMAQALGTTLIKVNDAANSEGE